MFDGLYHFCSKYAGGSIGGAVMLNWARNDIVINWAGGLHHGKRSEARTPPASPHSLRRHSGLANPSRGTGSMWHRHVFPLTEQVTITWDIS